MRAFLITRRHRRWTVVACFLGGWAVCAQAKEDANAEKGMKEGTQAGTKANAKTGESKSVKAPKKDSTKNLKKDIEKALFLYEQLAEGSMQSLNQMALACFHLAEKTDDINEQIARFEKAALTFEKAAAAGCAEAKYNAGLTLNKLGDVYKRVDAARAGQAFETAATAYRQCIAEQKKHPDLALKAAINLALMMLNGDIPIVTEEMSSWVELAQTLKPRYPKKVKDLMDTVMAIFIKLEASEEKKNESTATTPMASESVKTEQTTVVA